MIICYFVCTHSCDMELSLSDQDVCLSVLESTTGKSEQRSIVLGERRNPSAALDKTPVKVKAMEKVTVHLLPYYFVIC